MSKKLAVIISSIAAAVVAVVGVVFAGVWGSNTGVDNNTITVGTPATVTLAYSAGEKYTGTILPGSPVETEEYTVSIANTQGATYKLVLTKDATTTANLANFKVQVKINDGEFGTEKSLADSVVLADLISNNDTVVLKFTFSENAAVEEGSKLFVFDLALVEITP